MSFHVATGIPHFLVELGLGLTDFDATSETVYPFGDPAKNYWIQLGKTNTALALAVYVSEGSCSVTPEVTVDQELSVADVGKYAPEAFTVETGQLKTTQYGIDLVRLWWRVALTGGKGKVGWIGIQR